MEEEAGVRWLERSLRCRWKRAMRVETSGRGLCASGSPVAGSRWAGPAEGTSTTGEDGEGRDGGGGLRERACGQ